jgi:hypothetical protein
MSDPDFDTAKHYLLTVDSLDNDLTPLINEISARLGIKLILPPNLSRSSAKKATGQLWSLENGGIGNPLIKKSM